MKLKDNWEIKASLFDKARNLFKKGRYNPRFYLYRYHFNTYPKKFKMGKFPCDVIAEASNICNLRCTMCFQSDESLLVAKTTNTCLMNMDTFQRIVDECSENGLPALKLSWRGEPMLNKYFVDMIRYAKKKGILEVTSLTNATFMNEHMSQEIVGAKLDQLVISIDGYTKETYEKVRHGANYEEVVNNVKTLVKIRGKRRKPFIRLQYTESDINRHETQDFYHYWKDMVDEISISYCMEFDFPQKNQQINVPIYEFTCNQIFQRLVVMSDGTVCVCATDVMGSNTIGNIHKDSLKKLWTCQKLNEMRQQHKSGNYYKNPMCRICAHNINRASIHAGR